MTAESKSQLAYRFIRERIDDGRYVPGYRLVLGQIARELDVSVVPVREAIRLLEAEGLVTFERNVGAQVALVKETEYLHTMETLALVEEVVADAITQEQEDAWVAEQVAGGASVDGLFPMTAEWRARYEADAARHGERTGDDGR